MTFTVHAISLSSRLVVCIVVCQIVIPLRLVKDTLLVNHATFGEPCSERVNGKVFTHYSSKLSEAEPIEYRHPTDQITVKLFHWLAYSKPK